jgi:outer membrane protein OmpA-like peptidoglycan-associated protein
MSRGGVSHLGESGGENGSEVLGGIQLLRKDGSGQLDFGVGKGLADGVGTTAFRTFVAYTWIRPPTRREPPPEPVVIEEPPPEPPPILIEPDIEEPPPEPEWEPEEVAKVVRDQIVIRDPIQFVFAEDTILPESLETLEAIAEILHEHAEIEHLVIEGHASEEGSYEYNYDLSNLRARAIWKELMRNGVHPDRISYRGMGEVVPKDEGTDEESLATNRRVEFHIIDWIEGDEEYPDFPDSFRLPWSGDSVETVHPIRPPEPPEQEDKEEVETRVIDLLNPEQFDLYEDEEEEQ